MANISLDKSINQEIQVPCQKCSRKTYHFIIKSIDIEGKEDHEHHGKYEWGSNYQIIQCNGCKTYSFRHIYFNSEDLYQVSPEDFEPRIYENLYHNRLAGRERLNDNYLLPSKVRRIYN
jgi:hypothetical protein